jgi:hypothetical protein
MQTLFFILSVGLLFAIMLGLRFKTRACPNADQLAAVIAALAGDPDQTNGEHR